MKHILASCLLLLCWSCGQQKPAEKSADLSTEPGAEAPAPSPQNGTATAASQHPVAGAYVGYFAAKTYDDNQKISYSNKITVFLDSVSGTQLFGHSVVAGNNRPFSGAMRQEAGVYVAEVREPGDDKYDGQFYLRIDTRDSTVKGTWKAYKKLGVTEREYELKRTPIRYDPNLDFPEVGQWADLYDTYDEKVGKAEMVTDQVTRFNASARLLKKEEVENLYKADLEVIRNTIYARHGYSFKNRRMRYLFDSLVDWYVPTNTDVRSQLTELEKKNIDLLKRYEQHAERYYDDFGR
ncbi:MAG: YARHG domain-containing protein [Saprospiraceae bacterium]|nr:YARHG domain-containing protein [Saprospiraceae bacterium]